MRVHNMFNIKPHSINIIEFIDKGEFNINLFETRRYKTTLNNKYHIEYIMWHTGVPYYFRFRNFVCIPRYSFDIMTINYSDNDGEITFEMTYVATHVIVSHVQNKTTYYGARHVHLSNANYWFYRPEMINGGSAAPLYPVLNTSNCLRQVKPRI